MSTRSVAAVSLCVLLLAGCAQNSPEKSSSLGLESQAGGTLESSIPVQGKQAVIDQVMAESGMEEAIEQLPAMVAMGFDQQPAPPIGRREHERFREALLQAFEPVRVRRIVVDYLNAEYEPERFTALLAMMKTPLAKKMMALEMAANTPQAQQEMMQMGNVIMGQASPERLDLVRKLDEAVNATEMAVDMQMMMTRATVSNLNRIVPVAQKMTATQIDQMLAQMRAQMLYPARQYTHLNMVYAYRSVSDDELRAYLELHQTDLGRWSTRLMRGAWMKVSEQVAADLAREVERSFIQSNAL